VACVSVVCCQVCVADEKDLFEVCMSWFDHSRDDRSPDLHTVMKCVRFANIESYYFCDQVDSSPTLRQCDQLTQFFDKVRSYHMLPNRRAEV